MGTTTFKAVIVPSEKKQDGTYNVKIRVTHERQNRRIATNMFVTADDLTRPSLKIKNQIILDQCNDLIRKYREIVGQLGTIAGNLTVDEVIRFIKDVEKNDGMFRLNFIEFGREVAARKSKGTAQNYHSALNCLIRYIGRDSLDISDITAKFLENFEAFIASEPVRGYSRKHGLVTSTKTKAGGRSISMYMECLRAIHNEAKREFNQEDVGIIVIPQSPFKKYKVPKPPKSQHRALDKKIIQAIIDLPDMPRTDGPPDGFTRRDLARDCFLLSFGLAGMNAADLYDCEPQRFDKKEKVITYKRKKTRTRRDDEALMKIRVEPCIWPLVQKYLDKSGKRLFCFYQHYYSSDGFNVALRVGTQQVEKAIGAEHFTFYAARHSWATIGRSKAVNIDKYTIHEGLNHVDSEMKVTDIYTQRDYSLIWQANAKILKQFNWTSKPPLLQGP